VGGARVVTVRGPETSRLIKDIFLILRSGDSSPLSPRNLKSGKVVVTKKKKSKKILVEKYRRMNRGSALQYSLERIKDTCV
jgi:hypothetical protein